MEEQTFLLFVQQVLMVLLQAQLQVLHAQIALLDTFAHSLENLHRMVII